MDNTHPLFSILIANYNNGKYLMDAINSVRQQTYTNWEIIIVDDCSTDNSREVYQALEQDPQIRIYHNEQNRGCGYTKRRCAELAQGELCGFLDPDDALLPEALEVMVKAHVEHPEASLIGSCYWATDEQLNPQWHTELTVLPEGGDWLTTTTTTHHPIPFASYKRKVYEMTDGIDPMIKRAVDFDCYVRLEEKGPILFLSNITYLYRQHTNQISTHGDCKSLYWQCYVLTNACRRRGIAPDELANQLIMDNIDWYYCNAKGIPFSQKRTPFHKRLIRKCKKILKNILK